jgi:hypothetical protein
MINAIPQILWCNITDYHNFVEPDIKSADIGKPKI